MTTKKKKFKSLENLNDLIYWFCINKLINTWINYLGIIWKLEIVWPIII